MSNTTRDGGIEPRYRNVNEANRYMYENLQKDHDITIKVYPDDPELEEEKKKKKQAKKANKQGGEGEAPKTGTGGGDGQPNAEQGSKTKHSGQPATAYAHKYIITARCPKMFEKGSDKEGEQNNDDKELEVDGISPAGFNEVLRFLYYERTQLTPQNSFEVLHFARKYEIPVLEHICLKYIRDNITVKTVCDILSRSIKYDNTELRNRCTDFISKNTRAVLNDSSFYKTDDKVVDEIASLDYMDVEELHLFRSCVSWARGGPAKEASGSGEPLKGKELREKLKKPIKKTRFRFPTMKIEDFNQHVVPLELLTEEETVDVYNYLARPGYNKPKTQFNPVRRHLTRGGGRGHAVDDMRAPNSESRQPSGMK